MKKLIVCILAIAIFCSLCFLHASANNFNIFYDDTWHIYDGNVYGIKINDEFITPPIPPIIFSGRSVVPAREVFEALGASVAWNDKYKTVTVIKNDVVIVLTIDSNIAIVNGESFEMEIAPKIIAHESNPYNGKTMIPVRFVAEALNKKVDFIPEDGTILITDIKSEPDIPESTPPPNESDTPLASPDASYITGISRSVDRDYVRVIIKGNKDLSGYSMTILENPDRIAFDFYKFLPGAGISDITSASQVVNSVRIGSHEGFTRVVVDVTSSEYEISLSEDKTCLTVSFRVSTSSGSDNSDGSDKSADSDKVPHVFLDAGHGGTDPGALGKENGVIILKEKDPNLDITLMVGEILTKNGIKVTYSRTSDVTVNLYDRPELANEAGVDLFVSIHNNAMEDTSVNGSLILYSTTKSNQLSGEDVGNIILENLTSALNTKNLKARNGDKYVVLKYTTMPAIIVEVAFVTNKDNRDSLLTDEFKKKAAEAIAKGIMTSLDR